MALSPRFVSALALTVSVLASTACAPTRKPAASPGPSGAKATEWRRDLGRFASAAAAKPMNYDVSAYSLKGHFDWARLRLVARLAITLRTAAPTVEQIILDSRVTSVSGVSLNDGRTVPFTVDRDAGTLTVDIAGLPATERSGEIVLIVSYETLANDNSAGGLDPAALRAVLPRRGDPIQARTVNTMSEPEGAPQWLPSHDTPADRATFRAEIEVGADEAFIANGDLVRDERTSEGQRIIGYATRYSLPTYLMAFALGDFVHASQQLGTLPVDLWARRGLPVDYAGTLTNVARNIELYQSLVGPYPFEKYAIVLLPEFGGGEEHAGITFQGEQYGSDGETGGDRSMCAHELGHQWFGDNVTVTTWDDLWIKEGMATLLEAESSKYYSDRLGRGRLFGNSLEINDNEAIRDPALPPADKYTSGPYGRAAWVLNQIRARVGDQVFWATLRKVQRDHAYGTIGTDEFLAYWQESLGAAGVAQVARAVAAKALPKLSIADGAEGLALALTDFEGAMIAPLTVRLMAAPARFNSYSLMDGGKVLIAPSDQRLLVLDPEDRHPLAMFTRSQTAEFKARVVPRMTPQDAAGKAAFAALSSGTQEVVFLNAKAWFETPEEWTTLEAQLGSDGAHSLALAMVCKSLTAAQAPAFVETMTERIAAPRYAGVLNWYHAPDVKNCLQWVGAELFRAELISLVRDPASLALAPHRLEYLERLGFAPATALRAFGAVALNGASVRYRMNAERTLANYAGAPTATDPVVTEGLKLHFRTILTTSDVTEVLRPAILGAVNSLDEAALPLMAQLVKTHPFAPLKVEAACGSYQVTKSLRHGWEQFVAGLGSAQLLPFSVQEIIASPDRCPNR